MTDWEMIALKVILHVRCGIQVYDVTTLEGEESMIVAGGTGHEVVIV
jgi:hypothetical protein